MVPAFRFRISDVCNHLPPPGYYPGTITKARFRSSAQGNPMLMVVFTLEGVSEEYQQVADYFLTGKASARAIAIAHRRLGQLCRAAGFDDREDDYMTADDMLQARVEVKVVHDEYNGEPRLKIVAYRALGQAEPRIPF